MDSFLKKKNRTFIINNHTLAFLLDLQIKGPNMSGGGQDIQVEGLWHGLNCDACYQVGYSIQ